MNEMNIEFARLAAARKIMAPSASTGSIIQDRVNAERWIKRFAVGTLEPSASALVEAGEHSLLIRPKQPANCSARIFYIHGGGLVYYSTEVFQPLLSYWADALQLEIEAFDYLKAPEHTVEKSVEQLAASLTARCSAPDPRPIILAGDSVGGLLALYLSLRILPQTFSALALIYPVLDLQSERDSYRKFGDSCFLDSDAMRRFKAILSPYFTALGFNPFGLVENDIFNLPACSLVTAGCDVLCDEGLAWAQHLQDRGVKLRHEYFPDLPHDFCLYLGKLACARQAVAKIATTIFNFKEN